HKDVKAFGKMMVTDHTGVNKSAKELVAKLHVKPEDNPTAESLKKGGQENVAHLKTLKGDAFDKAYIEHEVAYHQQVIDAMDKTLIPSAQNAELKALLVKVRPAFVACAIAFVVASSGAAAATVHAVTIDGFAFKPASIVVKEGDSVEWRNTDPVPHTVTAKDAG